MAQLRAKSDGKDESSEIKEWFKNLYEVSKYSDDDLKQYYEDYRYQGFERLNVIKQLKDKIPDFNIAIQVIIICALNGPVKASQSKLKSGRTLSELGVPSSSRQSNKISCGKITAATADLAAYFLKKFAFPKRISSELPGWLQFPSAASIKMPENYRELHRKFAMEFSKKIGGEFNESIYETMVTNSYNDDRLKLFQ